MARSSVLGALGAALLAASLCAGCDDDATKAAQAAAAQAKAQAEATLASVEQNAGDPSKFDDVMHDIAKARVQSFGDNSICDRLDQAAATARQARDKQLEVLWAKAEGQAKDALGQTEPEPADKACGEALAAIDRLAPPVLAVAGTKADDFRAQLMDRSEAAKRATEIMAKAKEMKEADETARARALIKSFDVVPSLKASPFGGKVLAMLSEIPEKTAAADAGEWITLFDGSSDLQINYFEKQHDWVWKVNENVLVGDNTDNDGDSSLWLGDDSWTDLICEIQFSLEEERLDFHARETVKKSGDEETPSFDHIALSTGAGFEKGTWYAVKLEVKGNKLTLRADGVKQGVDLTNPKGRIAFTLPGRGVVKIREIKIKLLTKDAKKPVQKVVEPSKKEEPESKGKKKKKKKTEADKGDKKDDEKKDDEKKKEGEK
jgi:hypothetical protein